MQYNLASSRGPIKSRMSASPKHQPPTVRFRGIRTAPVNPETTLITGGVNVRSSTHGALRTGENAGDKCWSQNCYGYTLLACISIARLFIYCFACSSIALPARLLLVKSQMDLNCSTPFLLPLERARRLLCLLVYCLACTSIAMPARALPLLRWWWWWSRVYRLICFLIKHYSVHQRQ